MGKTSTVQGDRKCTIIVLGSKSCRLTKNVHSFGGNWYDLTLALLTQTQLSGSVPIVQARPIKIMDVIIYQLSKQGLTAFFFFINDQFRHLFVGC